MRFAIITIFFFLVLGSAAIADTDPPSLKCLRSASQVESSHIGEGGTPSEIYECFSELIKEVSDERLMELQKDPSPVVRAYVGSYFAERSPNKILPELFSDDTPINTIEGCEMGVDTVGDYLKKKLNVFNDLRKRALTNDISDKKTPSATETPKKPMFPDDPKPDVDYKPVIYLYPEIKQQVKIFLHYKGKLTTTYPYYDAKKGWDVTASPDGTLLNNADGREYSYLFWEGKDNLLEINDKEGFVVKGSDTAEFLRSKLSQLGLLPKEFNEFIVYWLPKMEGNNYNFIHFAGGEYTKTAELEISPEPDSILRVFMVLKPLKHPIEVKEQKLTPFERRGFSVVEWGGRLLK